MVAPPPLFSFSVSVVLFWCLCVCVFGRLVGCFLTKCLQSYESFWLCFCPFRKTLLLPFLFSFSLFMWLWLWNWIRHTSQPQNSNCLIVYFVMACSEQQPTKPAFVIWSSFGSCIVQLFFRANFSFSLCVSVFSTFTHKSIHLMIWIYFIPILKCCKKNQLLVHCVFVVVQGVYCCCCCRLFGRFLAVIVVVIFIQFHHYYRANNFRFQNENSTCF